MSKSNYDLASLVKYLSTKEKNRTSDEPETYHFFRREYSFSCYCSQAVSIADEYYKTKRVVRIEQGMECVDISRKLLAKIGGSLLERLCKIAIWHKPNPSPTSSWELQLEASPGNFDKLEDELGSLEKDASSSCYSIAIAVAENNPYELGIALLSSVTRYIYLYKFRDNDEYSRLRSLAMRFNVETIHIAVRTAHIKDPTGSSSSKPLSPHPMVQNDVNSSSLSPTALEISVRKSLCKAGMAVSYIALDFIKGGQEALRRKILSELDALNIVDKQTMINSTHSLAVMLDESDLWMAVDAAGALLHNLKIWNDKGYRDSFRISSGCFDDILLYDKTVVDVLQVFPTSHMLSFSINEDGPSSSSNRPKCNSLFELINETKSKMGNRLLRQWLQHPLRDSLLIKRRQNAINFFLENVETMNLLRESREYLKNFPDMERLALKLRSIKVVTNAGDVLKEMLELYKCTLRAIAIGEVLKKLQVSSVGNDQSDETNVVSTLDTHCKVFHKFHGLIEELVDIDHMQRLSFNANIRANASTAIDTSKPLVFHKDRYYRVKPSFSNPLTQLYESMMSIEGLMVTCYSDLQRKLGQDMKDLHLEDSQVHGMHFRVTKRLSPKILKSMDSQKISYDVLSNQKAGTLFITKDMKALVQKFSNLRLKYQDEQISIVQQALEVVQSYTVPALHAANLVAEIDVFSSLAFKALQNDWVRPQIVSAMNGNARNLLIKGLRHPILEEKIGALNIVPNDVKVSPEDGFCMIITGPNMGGKSTYMKAIGLAVLLAQMGSYVPASSATLPIYDQLFVRSGSSDLSVVGVSSFMAEMLDTADIIRHATPHSLVLIDEIGRGTSTCDGFGIAWAILEELAFSNQSTVFCATHFHELNNLVTSTDNEQRKIFKSLHVDAHIDKDLKDVSMLYQVKEGSSSKSYGIHVAQVANFPEEIISKALEIESCLNIQEHQQGKRPLVDSGSDETDNPSTKIARYEELEHSK